MSNNGSYNNSGTSSSWLGSSLTFNLITVVVIVICLLGIPANIAVIIKLSHHLRGSSISQRLFFTLATSDLLCLLCLSIGMVIAYSGFNLTYVTCQLLSYVFLFCISSELNIMVLIGIQRYCQILHSKKWAMLGRTWQRLLLSSVWMGALLQAIPAAFSFEEQKGIVPRKELPHYCGNYTTKPEFTAGYTAFIFFNHLTLLTFYVLLVRGIRQAKIGNRKQPRANILFIRIIAVSLVCGCFPLILRLGYEVILSAKLDEKQHASEVLAFVEYFFFFSHALNPFLYFFVSQYAQSGSSSTKNSFLND